MQIKFNIKLSKSCHKIGFQKKNKPQNGDDVLGPVFCFRLFYDTNCVSFNLRNSYFA